MILVITLATAGIGLEVLVRVDGVSSLFIPAPSEVLLSLPGAISSLLAVLPETIAEVLLAFSISLVLGLTIGLLMGNLEFVYSVGNGYFSALYSTPKVIFLPLMILWFGLGLRAVAIFAILEAVLPMIIMLSAAVHDIDRDVMRVATSMGASRLQMQTKVIVPALTPAIFSAAQVGLVFSVIGVLLAQMYLGAGGIGALLLNDAYKLRIAELYAVALLFAVITIALLSSTKYLVGRRVAGWHSRSDL